jgi:DNA polymerase/3'-5' exonuclease PolX
MAVAQDLIDALTDHCERICFAGSLRRRKPFVKDVEILFVPKYSKSDERSPREDLFAAPSEPKPVNNAEVVIENLLNAGLLAKRKNVNGREAWGEKNKLAVHVPSGIALDLFAATPENFYNYLVCRTGGAENNVRICSAAIARGWKWNPYGTGFSRLPASGDIEELELHPVMSEREVFEFVGLPYLEPWDR